MTTYLNVLEIDIGIEDNGRHSSIVILVIRKVVVRGVLESIHQIESVQPRNQFGLIRAANLLSQVLQRLKEHFWNALRLDAFRESDVGRQTSEIIRVVIQVNPQRPDLSVLAVGMFVYSLAAIPIVGALILLQ